MTQRTDAFLGLFHVVLPLGCVLVKRLRGVNVALGRVL